MSPQSLARVFGTGIVTLLVASTVAFAGGANGGGGNPTNPTVANSHEVSEAISDAKMALPIFVRAYLNIVQEQPHKAGAFFGPSQLFTKDLVQTRNRLDSVHWEIFRNKLCHYVDASGKTIRQVGSGDPVTNTICLSESGLLKYKFPTNLIQGQTLALAFREFSHLLGANEDQAAQFQIFAVTLLGNYSFENLRNFENSYAHVLEGYYNDSGIVLESFDNSTNAKSSESLLDQAECADLEALATDAVELGGIVRGSENAIYELGIYAGQNPSSSIGTAMTDTVNLFNHSCPERFEPSTKTDVINQLRVIHAKLCEAETRLYRLSSKTVSSSCSPNVSNSK